MLMNDNKVMPETFSQEVLSRAKVIKLVVFDVDGVMTDGGLTIGDDGQEYKTFNSQDGLGMKLLKDSGVQLAIITGRTSNIVKQRSNSIGIAHFYQGVDDKLAVFNELVAKLAIAPEHAAFMGDDVIDVPPMLRCGLAVSVPAAPSIVQARAHYVTKKHGGHGAVRELCELIMHAQNTFETQMAPYFK